MILFHDLLDRMRPSQFGSLAWLWSLLHKRGGVLLPFGVKQFVLFPLVPLVGVMAAGYVLGRLYTFDRERRKQWLMRLGLGMIALFIALRLTNLYGNPPVGVGGVSARRLPPPAHARENRHPVPRRREISALAAVSVDDARAFAANARLARSRHGPLGLSALWTFGRVPMFFYVLHLYVIHTRHHRFGGARPVAALAAAREEFSAKLPPGYGYGLPFVYLMWITTVLLLYLPCRWFAELKRRRKDWWLSYL